MGESSRIEYSVQYLIDYSSTRVSELLRMVQNKLISGFLVKFVGRQRLEMCQNNSKNVSKISILS